MADDTKTTFAAPRPPYDTSPPPSIIATAETRIKALIESLHRELQDLEGEASEFLVNARKHVANVAVHAQITGELTSVHFEDGGEVEKGQVLFTLDRRAFEAAVNQAEATLQRDLAQAANARSQQDRYRGLAERGIATREQVEQMSASATALDATVEADRAAVESAKVQFRGEAEPG